MSFSNLPPLVTNLNGTMESTVAHSTVDTNGRAVLKPNIDPANLPPLPVINSESLKHQVFTHRSLYARSTHVFEDPPNDPSPDNESLEHLGDAVLSLVVTELLRDMYPNLRVGPSTKIRALVVGNQTLACISVMYKLPNSLYTHPAQAITLQASTNIQADLFESYVAGVYRDGGLDVVKAWLRPLFRAYIQEAYRIVRVQHGLSPDPSPASPESAPGALWQAHHVSSRRAVIVGHLSLFNQYIQQKNKTVEWVYADSAGVGTKTTPIWVVQAMVDRQCLGHGRGNTKKAARNEAAKEGLRKMGVCVPLQPFA